jgi:hypothetical protein
VTSPDDEDDAEVIDEESDTGNVRSHENFKLEIVFIKNKCLPQLPKLTVN